MLERNRRRVGGSSKYSKKCCQTTCLLIITAMNLIGVIVLIILFACHKAQEFRRNPPIFTSTLSFEQLPQFPSTHFTRLTSDETQQFLRTEFFENYRLPQAIWIFADNLRTAPCCEIGTQLTPVYEEEFTEASPPSFTPPEPSTFDLLPTAYTDSIYPTITVTLPQITTTTTEEEVMNEYFTGWGVTVPQIQTIFTNVKSPSEMFTGKLASKKLISNQVDRIVGPPSIKPTTMENFEINTEFIEEKKITKIGPPSTAPNEFQLKTLEEKEQKADSVSDYAENVVTDAKLEKTDSAKLNNVETTVMPIPSIQSTTKGTSEVSNNVLMGIPKGTTAIFLDCSTEKNQHSSHSCKQWKAAGYCNGHTATKYLFCRYQCLCA